MPQFAHSKSKPILVCLLLCQLHAVGSAQTRQWPDQKQHGPFKYHANFSLQRSAEILAQTARLPTEIPLALGLEPRKELINVYLFKNKRSYRAYLNMYFPELPGRKALFIRQRGINMVFAHLSDDFDVDLRHESAHAVLHSMMPMVPLWLDEGLAEYFEVEQSHRQFANPHFDSVTRKLKRGSVRSIDELEELDDFAKMKTDHYRDSWAWIHFFLHGPPQAKAEFRRYLQDIQNHIPPGKLSLRIRNIYADPESQLLRHLIHSRQQLRLSLRR